MTRMTRAHRTRLDSIRHNLAAALAYLESPHTSVCYRNRGAQPTDLLAFSRQPLTDEAASTLLPASQRALGPYTLSEVAIHYGSPLARAFTALRDLTTMLDDGH